jgi:hypothetical protein
MSVTASERPAEWSPSALGRSVAAFYLATIVLGIVAQLFIGERLISLRDPARTASAILANDDLYRTGFSLYMLEMAAQVTFTVLFFHLLKPVSPRIATLALTFTLVGCTIKTFSRVFYLAPLILLKNTGLTAQAPDQLGAITATLLTVNDRGAAVALAFFGFGTLLEGWLVLRSTFLPPWLGALKIVSGIGWLTFLSPTLGYAAFNIVAPIALIGSVATIGWLLVKGVDEERWRALVPKPAGGR